jgi:uncharacterized protein involved in exopolysaccharide biosynthesis
MSGKEYEGEREVDLGRWRRAVVAWWWLPVAGLVLGGLAGAILSLGGGSNYKAQALLSLGQPFSPGGGAPVNTFATNPRAVNEIIRSESALKEAAARCAARVGTLRGKVTSAQVGVGTGAARTAVPLITVTVTGPQSVKVECAANDLARVVVRQTTGPYVGTKIATFEKSLQSYQDQLDSLVPLVRLLERTLNDKSLKPLDRLVIATQLDNAQTRRGQLLGLQTAAQQQLALSQNVESAKVIRPAVAVKSTARSRRNSILVGALIGLILGSIAAIVADARGPRAT